MKIISKHFVLLVVVLIAVVGFCTYLKLCVIGWKREWLLAVGIVHMQASSKEDAQILSRMADKISTASTAEIVVESGLMTDPPWADTSNGHSVRLMLNGHGVTARGYLRFDPLRIEHTGPNEDADVFQKIVDLAKSRGVAAPIKMLEIKTPINVVTDR
jgi:hypothetical protein